MLLAAYGAFLWNADQLVLLCIVPIRLTLRFHYREQYVLLSLSTLPLPAINMCVEAMPQFTLFVVCRSFVATATFYWNQTHVSSAANMVNVWKYR